MVEPAPHTFVASEPNSAPLEPFALVPVAVERIWGTDRLRPWHADPLPGTAVGEIWLTAEDCNVDEGPFRGQSLAAVTATEPDALGDPRREGFPLLIKLLFPREKLSVQVQPDDAAAQALGMPRGKTECWYVLSAEPGAEVALGFREPTSAAQVRRAIEEGTLESKLRMLPVKAGDLVFVDAGTVHAIGPGMVVLETQQYSDTTYRLWDYGRPRELHIEAGAAATRTETAAGLVTPQPQGDFVRLVSCPYFTVDRFDLREGQAVELGSKGQLQILIALGEGGSLQWGDSRHLPLPLGRAVVVPAGGDATHLQSAAGLAVIRVLQP